MIIWSYFFFNMQIVPALAIGTMSVNSYNIWHNPIVVLFCFSTLSETRWFSKLILYISYLSPQVSYFSKEIQFFLLKNDKLNKIWELNVLDVTEVSLLLDILT